MKGPINRYILWVLSLLIIQISVKAQTAPAPPPPPKEKLAIDIDAGVAYPFGQDLSNVFKAGVNATVGIKRAFLKKRRLWIRPEGGIKYYTKKANLGQDMRETFRTWKAGLEIQYRVKDYKKFSFFPILRVDNNWCANQFSNLSKDQTTGTRLNEVPGNYLDATGISFDAGIMVVRAKSIYVKLDYEYFQPTLKASPDLIKALYTEGIIMPETRKLDCSTINLSVGVNLNFKQ